MKIPKGTVTMVDRFEIWTTHVTLKVRFFLGK